MATKLYTQYGFSKDNLKVLLGGWNKWNELHTSDPNGYPTEVTAGAAPQQPGVGLTIVPGGGGTTPNLVTVPTTAP